MLKVKFQPLSIAAMAEGPARQRALSANEKAKSFAQFLRKSSRHDGCDEHYDEESYVSVVARADGAYEVIKSEFCCSEFAAKYAFENPPRYAPLRVFSRGLQGSSKPIHR